jgi:hypothetical protein
MKHGAIPNSVPRANLINLSNFWGLVQRVALLIAIPIGKLVHAMQFHIKD